MSVPKSVTKIKKTKSGASVEYTSNVDAANYYMFELTRAALRDVGKYIKKQWQIAYDAHFKKRTGAGRLSTKVIVYSNKNTQYPHLDVGLPHASKGKKENGFYSYFQEFGTSRQPKLGLLTKSVNENIEEIIKIESQYLTALNEDETSITSKINEGEYED